MAVDFAFLLAIGATVLVVGISLWLFQTFRASLSSSDEPEDVPRTVPEPPAYVKELALELPNTTVLPQDAAPFKTAMNGWFSAQNRDIIPACIVRPQDVKELSTAMVHIHREHARRANGNSDEFDGKGLFAIRAGGANPSTGISGVENGVLLDLSLFKQIEPAEDGSSVTIGAGAYWRDVYHILEGRGLGVVGGRSSPVGVGGSTLQGGMSHWSPLYGFICANVISYEVVLADGSIVNASADENQDLWRALKGGGNNFGVISKFKLRSFPAPKEIWAGSFITPGFLHKSTLEAFHEHAKRNGSGEPGTYDEHASPPILSLSYLTDFGISAFFCTLAHTKPSPTSDWPEYWQKSPFRSLWRFQNTFKNKTIQKAVVELGSVSPLDKRNAYGTTTIKNDLETLKAVRQIWSDAIPSIKHVKNCMFIFVVQMILPQWINRGDPTVLGLEDCQEPLIIVSFAVLWQNRKDDAIMVGKTRECIEKIEEYAAAKGTGHPFRFSNYSSEWQKPLNGYGHNNMQFMRTVSEKYDPEGLFQKGCLGGFKLDG